PVRGERYDGTGRGGRAQRGLRVHDARPRPRETGTRQADPQPSAGQLVDDMGDEEIGVPRLGDYLEAPASGRPDHEVAVGRAEGGCGVVRRPGGLVAGDPCQAHELARGVEAEASRDAGRLDLARRVVEELQELVSQGDPAAVN